MNFFKRIYSRIFQNKKAAQPNIISKTPPSRMCVLETVIISGLHEQDMRLNQVIAYLDKVVERNGKHFEFDYGTVRWCLRKLREKGKVKYRKTPKGFIHSSL